MEYVHDEVAEVEEDPAPLGTTLAAERLGSVLDQLVFDLTRDRDDVSFVTSGGEKENIGERKGPGNVQSNEVLGLLGICGVRSNREKLAGMVGRSHKVLWGGRETELVTGLEDLEDKPCDEQHDYTDGHDRGRDDKNQG
jgi:hypothetical protein